MELVGNHVLELPRYVDLLGMRPLSAEPGHVRMEFTASEQFLNPAGVVQGGFITAMLDDTMGPAAVAQLGPGYFAPTLELKVSFLRPVGPGRWSPTGAWCTWESRSRSSRARSPTRRETSSRRQPRPRAS